MSVKLFTILLALFSMAHLPAEGASQFEYGPRPALSVFDPSGVLEAQTVKEISDPLETVRKKEDVDVIVVILQDIGDAPPEHVAGQFAAAWCNSDIHCVVLHIPGREDSPWIIPAGKLIGYVKPQQVQEGTATVRRHAASEPKDADKVRVAAKESSDMLRFWLGSAINRSQTMLTESARMRVESETSARRTQIAILVGVASIIPLIVGIAFFISLLGKRGPRHFPHHAWQLRLGAPHSGGNNAVVELGPPKP